MRIDDARFLFAYDRWANRKVLAQAVGIADGGLGGEQPDRPARPRPAS